MAHSSAAVMVVSMPRPSRCVVWGAVVPDVAVQFPGHGGQRFSAGVVLEVEADQAAVLGPAPVPVRAHRGIGAGGLGLAPPGHQPDPVRLIHVRPAPAAGIAGQGDEEVVDAQLVAQLR
jgi:hypothetical protein